MSAEAIPAGTYTVDPAHSNVGFKVRHMGIATVHGAFKQFQGTVEASDTLKFSGSVEVTSIDTGDVSRDAHLQSPAFFDAAQHPQITFTSASTQAADGKLTVIGDITIHGVTKRIELTGEIGEGGEDPWGNFRIGFEVSGKIDRRDFDLTWNQTFPGGNFLVSTDVKLIIGISAVKAA